MIGLRTCLRDAGRGRGAGATTTCSRLARRAWSGCRSSLRLAARGDRRGGGACRGGTGGMDSAARPPRRFWTATSSTWRSRIYRYRTAGLSRGQASIIAGVFLLSVSNVCPPLQIHSGGHAKEGHRVRGGGLPMDGRHLSGVVQARPEAWSGADGGPFEQRLLHFEAQWQERGRMPSVVHDICSLWNGSIGRHCCVGCTVSMLLIDCLRTSMDPFLMRVGRMLWRRSASRRATTPGEALPQCGSASPTCESSWMCGTRSGRFTRWQLRGRSSEYAWWGALRGGAHDGLRECDSELIARDGVMMGTSEGPQLFLDTALGGRVDFERRATRWSACLGRASSWSEGRRVDQRLRGRCREEPLRRGVSWGGGGGGLGRGGGLGVR